MRIELVIDELRLHGFDPRHRHAVADSLEREAAALIAAHLPRLAGAISGTADAVDGGRFHAGRDAASTGRAIATVVVDAVLAQAGPLPGASPAGGSPAAGTVAPGAVAPGTVAPGAVAPGTVPLPRGAR